MFSVVPLPTMSQKGVVTRPLASLSCRSSKIWLLAPHWGNSYSYAQWQKTSHAPK